MTVDMVNAKVYLQGNSAVMNYHLEKDAFVGYVGGKKSIKIIDRRPKTTSSVQGVTSGKVEDTSSFADIFNEPAKVSIFVKANGWTTIVLSPIPENEEITTHTLWLGVIWDGKMPVHKIIWEKLSPVYIDEKTVTAFVCLIDNSEED